MSVLDNLTRLRRFCFLGAFEAIYVHNGRTPVNVARFFPFMEEYCRSVDGATIVTLVSDAMPQTIRRDEPLFVYAVYLSTQPNDNRTTARQAFTTIVQSDEDLFLFCKYAFLIRDLDNKRGVSRTIRKAITSWYETQTAGDLREMWLNHRGEHGFTHQGLIRLCHVKNSKIGDGVAGNMFFKTCSDLILEDQRRKAGAEEKLDTADDATQAANVKVENETETTEAPAAASKKTGPSPLLVAMSRLRTTKNKNEALKIIRKHKLKYHQVPMCFKRYTLIMESLLPSMSYMAVLKNWGKFGRADHFKSRQFFQLCQDKMENKQLLRSENIHPIVFLMQKHSFNFSGDSGRMTPNKLELYKVKYYNQLFEESFGENPPTGMRMHITINLQPNYRKKYIRHQKNLTYFEAVIAMAFAYFKTEKSVDVFYWYDDCMQLMPIKWSRSMNIHEAMAYCDTLPTTTSKQRLALPVVSSFGLIPTYDLFLALVPTAGRSNPGNSSDLLCNFIDQYNTFKKSNSRFVIVDVLKYRRSMYYSSEKVENILEICGLDENTPKLINHFGLHSFS